MKHDQAGFGLPEIIIAIVVLGSVSLGAVSLLNSILNVQAAANFRKEATFAAQREIESLRNSNYNQLTAGSTIDFTSQLPSDLPPPVSGTVSVTEPVAGLKRVDITVSYKFGVTKQVKVSSIIGEIGISQ